MDYIEKIKAKYMYYKVLILETSFGALSLGSGVDALFDPSFRYVSIPLCIITGGLAAFC